MLCWRYIVLDVASEVYHTQHIFKYTMYVLLEVVNVVLIDRGLPYTTHFQKMLCVNHFRQS